MSPNRWTPQPNIDWKKSTWRYRSLTASCPGKFPLILFINPFFIIGSRSTRQLVRTKWICHISIEYSCPAYENVGDHEAEKFGGCSKWSWRQTLGSRRIRSPGTRYGFKASGANVSSEHSPLALISSSMPNSNLSAFLLKRQWGAEKSSRVRLVYMIWL